MSRFYHRIKQYADEASIVGVGLAACVAVVLAFGAYFGGPKVAKEVTTGEPGVPVHDTESARGPDMPRGSAVGAAGQSISPAAFLEAQGIRYAFYPSPNVSAFRIGDAIEAIVVHVADGSCPGMRSWFANPVAQVSAHFGVCKNGDVDQYVDLSNAAWHAGICNRWTAPADRWCGAGINPNRRTIGVELELRPGERISDYPAMQASLEVLLGWLLEHYELTADREHIIAHADIDSVNRSIDPHCCVDLDALIGAVATDATPPAAPISPAGLAVPPDYSPECWTDIVDPVWKDRWNHCGVGYWVFPDGSFYLPLTNGHYYANGVPK